MEKEISLKIVRKNSNITPTQYKEFKDAFNLYKDYNTIIRNMNEIYPLINYNFSLKSELFKGNCSSETQKLYTSILESNLYTIIIVYARWFQKTKKKIKLEKEDFFADNYELMECHKKILNKRNKYIAHYEKDIWAIDKFYIKNDNGMLDIESKFEKEILPSDDELNNIKKCIEVVNNKILNEKITQAKNNLINIIKKYNIRIE